MRQKVAKNLDLLVKNNEVVVPHDRFGPRNRLRAKKRFWNGLSHIERGTRRYVMDLATGKRRIGA